jgi:hypothetical protein
MLGLGLQVFRSCKSTASTSDQLVARRPALRTISNSSRSAHQSPAATVNVETSSGETGELSEKHGQQSTSLIRTVLLHALHLRHGTVRFTSPPTEVGLSIFIAVGRASTHNLWVQRQARNPYTSLKLYRSI